MYGILPLQRLNQEQKLLIQRAADLEGRSMTDFDLHSAELAAERILQRRATLVLTARETEAFVDALLHPPNPGPVLRRAARDYRQKIARYSAAAISPPFRRPRP